MASPFHSPFCLAHVVMLALLTTGCDLTEMLSQPGPPPSAAAPPPVGVGVVLAEAETAEAGVLTEAAASGTSHEPAAALDVQSTPALSDHDMPITAEQLAAEFQSDPTGASQKYGSPYGPIGPLGPIGPFGPLGPHGGRAGPHAPGGIIISPESPPAHRDQIELAATVAYRLTIAGKPLLYLVTPPGLPAVNIPAGDDQDEASLLSAAEPGQTVRAILDAAAITMGPDGGPGTVSVSTRQIEIHGEPAEPFGPLAATDFFRELADPQAVAKYQGRPVILTGAAFMSHQQGPMLGFSDGQGGMVGCMLQATERKALQAVKRGQMVSVRGTYIQPHGRNQLMLQGAVFVAGQ